MRKNKLYIVLVILTITFLFATAAVCTQCGASIDKAIGGLADDADDSKKSNDADDSKKSADTDDSGKEGESKDTDGDKEDSDRKDEPKPEDIKIDDENKKPVITSIFLDGLDPAVYDFSANGVHTVKAEATDPEGGSLTFKWSGDGTITGEDINPMSWTAPDSEGRYEITVEVTDDKGAAAAMTADIYVIPELELAEPPKEAVILDVEILGSDDGKYYQDKVYTIKVIVDDPDGLIVEYDYSCSDCFGNVIILVNNNTMKWGSPLEAGDCYIRAYILDSEGSILDEETIKIKIEPI